MLCYSLKPAMCQLEESGRMFVSFPWLIPKLCPSTWELQLEQARTARQNCPRKASGITGTGSIGKTSTVSICADVTNTRFSLLRCELKLHQRFLFNAAILHVLRAPTGSVKNERDSQSKAWKRPASPQTHTQEPALSDRRRAKAFRCRLPSVCPI